MEAVAVEILNCYHAASLVLAREEGKQLGKESLRVWRKVHIGL